MVPTLKHGDLLLVRLGPGAQVGDVVLARFHSMPERFVLKRLAGIAAEGADLASDNAFAGGDSRTHGPADVLGRVVLRRRAGSLRISLVRQRPSDR